MALSPLKILNYVGGRVPESDPCVCPLKNSILLFVLLEFNTRVLIISIIPFLLPPTPLGPSLKHLPPNYMICLFQDRVSLCGISRPGIYSVDQADLTLTEIHLPQHG